MDKRKQQLIAALVLFAIAIVLSYYSVEEKEVITKNGASEADVVLVLDVSGSMVDIMENKSKIEFVTDASIKFLNTLNTAHRVGLVTFSDSSQVLPLTSDRAYLEQKIRELDARGGTNMLDAVKKGIDTLLTQNGTKRRLYLVLMTDGYPSLEQDPTSQIPTLVSKNIVVYTVGFGINANESLLKNIADKTNGTYSYANSRVDLINAFVKVGDSVNTVTEMKDLFYYGSRGLIIIAIILIILLPEFIETSKKIVAKINGKKHI